MNFKNFLSQLEKDHPKFMRLLVRIRRHFSMWDKLVLKHESQNYYSKIRSCPLLPEPEDAKAWILAFDDYLRSNPRRIELLRSFSLNQITLIQSASVKPADQAAILICVIKNDLDRIKMVFDHHRKIGISHFVILDNDSDDGTFEWLSKQKDVDLYQTKEKFESLKKYGWINSLLMRYGFNRWYLYVDSDELFTYTGCETQPVDSLIQKIKANGHDRTGSIMLDMYSDRGIFQKDLPDNDIRSTYCWFDSDTYEFGSSARGLTIKGGPRKRLFSDTAGDSPLIIKYPLFYLSPGMIFESAHYLYPYRLDIPVSTALLHFKFLPGDLARYHKIAQDGNFQNNSKEYRTYLEKFNQDPTISFKYMGSTRYQDSNSLLAIEQLKHEIQKLQESR